MILIEHISLSIGFHHQELDFYIHYYQIHLQKDGLLWFSKTANELLYEEYFTLTNIEKDFLPVFKKFYSNEELRTCPKTGEIMEIDDRFFKE